MSLGGDIGGAAFVVCIRFEVSEWLGLICNLPTICSNVMTYVAS